MVSQTDSKEVSTLIETNNLLTKQLVEKNESIASKNQKYIDVLELQFKGRLRNQELSSKVKEQESEIAQLKVRIQEFNEKNFCHDLIQLEGI